MTRSANIEGEVKMSKREIIDINVEELNPYHEKIFHLYEGARLEEMVESIKSSGVLTPIIVRTHGDGYQILGGHNRVNASMLAGRLTVPAINYGELSESEAKFIVTETNLMQRGFSELSLLEKAACIAIRYDAMKNQGIRVDLLDELANMNEEDLAHSNVKLAKEFEMSASTISRYVKIHSLSDAMKDLIRDGKLNFSSALYLSFLTEEHQWLVASIIVELNANVSKKEAESIKVLEETDYLTEEAVKGVLTSEPSVAKTGLKLGVEFMKERFPGMTDKAEVLKIIESALDMWFGVED